jgi:hypothetical protein
LYRKERFDDVVCLRPAVIHHRGLRGDLRQAGSEGYRPHPGNNHSLHFVIVLAALLLGEALSWKSAIGALLMIAGAIIISV